MRTILTIACLVALSFAAEASAQCAGGVCSLAARPVRAVAQSQPVRRVLSSRPLQRVVQFRPGQRVVGVVRRPLGRLFGR